MSLVTPATSKLPKPRGAEDFEDIAADALRERWRDPNLQRHGRSGQRQHGVDILGHPVHWAGALAGAQCKHTDKPDLDEVLADASAARAQWPDLAEFLVLTSADRDAQWHREFLRATALRWPGWSTGVMFWQDIADILAGSPQLVQKHWKGFSLVPSGVGEVRFQLLPRPLPAADAIQGFHILVGWWLADSSARNALDLGEFQAVLRSEIMRHGSSYLWLALATGTRENDGSWSFDPGSRATNVITHGALSLEPPGAISVQFQEYWLSGTGATFIDPSHILSYTAETRQVLADALTRLGITPLDFEGTLLVRCITPPRLNDPGRVLQPTGRMIPCAASTDIEVQAPSTVGTVDDERKATHQVERLLTRLLTRFEVEKDPLRRYTGGPHPELRPEAMSSILAGF